MLTACIFGSGDCGPPGQYVAVPSGQFAPAALRHEIELVGEPFFTDTFPRGAKGTLGAGGRGGQGGAPDLGGDFVPSARLRIDRRRGFFIRSYVDDDGRKVEERFRIKERR